MIKNILIGFLLLTALMSFFGSAKMYFSIKKTNGEPSEEEVKTAVVKLGASVFLWPIGLILLFIAYKIHE